MKLFTATFAIVTASAFAICVANPAGMSFAENSTNTQLDTPITQSNTEYSNWKLTVPDTTNLTQSSRPEYLSVSVYPAIEIPNVKYQNNIPLVITERY